MGDRAWARALELSKKPPAAFAPATFFMTSSMKKISAGAVPASSAAAAKIAGDGLQTPILKLSANTWNALATSP